MEICVIGSGCGVPSLSRGAPGMLLRVGTEEWLIDCGISVPWGLLRFGSDITRIDRILLTHFHPDHTAGLVPFLFACKYPAAPRRKDLCIIGPSGLRSFYESLQKPYDNWLAPQLYNVDFIEVGHGDVLSWDVSRSTCLLNSEHPDALRPNVVTVQTFKLEHTPVSVGYRITDEEGRIVAISGDTDICDSLVELSKGADLLVLECSFMDAEQVLGHLSPSKVARIIAVARPRKILLTHLYPVCTGIDIVSELNQLVPGYAVVVADDGMKISM